MLELYGVKRTAKANEVGIFFDTPVFAEDFAKVKLGTELRVELTTERQLKLLAFAWVLAGKIADNSDWFLDKQDAMDAVPNGLKCLAGHADIVLDPATGGVKVKPKSLRRLDGEEFRRLLDRMVFVTCRDIIPGMDANRLTEEIEAMCIGKERK